MKNKFKLITLIILINLSFKAMGLEKNNSELIVSGKEMWERVDYALSPYPEDVDHYLNNGDVDMKHAFWADEGSAVHNIGNIYTKRQNYDTQAGGVLIGWPNNALKKQDDLIVLRGGADIPTTFINDGMVDMGITYHKIDIVLSVLDLVFYKKYADYTKNVINAQDSDIINRGTIQSQGDKLYYRTDVQVGLAQYNDTHYNKNVILMNGGKLTNSGLIQYDRDRSIEIVPIVGVNLVELGLHYNRDKAAVNSINSTVINNTGGKIFIGGDLYEKTDYGGISLDVIGAKLVGKHNKYGIKANGGVVKNFGTIEVERDFTKALDDYNNILDLYLIYKEILGLGLLAFNRMDEKSVGVSVTNGTFYNDGGTISVGANNKKHDLQILYSSASAVEADNSQVYFNTDENGKGTGKTSTINLEGQNVFATFLMGNSEVIFDGITEINFKLPAGLEENKKSEYISVINKEILHRENGATGNHIVKGILRINGNFDNTNAGLIVEQGGRVEQTGMPKETTWGKIISTGTVNLNDDIKIGTENLIGLSEEQLKKYKNQVIVSAEKGITGNGNLVSGSYIFLVGSDKSEGKNLQNDLSIIDIKRKNFNSIVDNRELGQILEDSYEGVSGEKLDFYKYIASGENKDSFSKKLNEITGIDNITTLETQVMDITKDLNKQYRNFIKSNKEEGVVFSYLNSRSEINKNGKYDGFERKSNGIMTGYNKKISDSQNVGLGFSYMKSDIDYTSNSTNKIETWNGRIYSDHTYKNLNTLNELSFGYNKSENKRYINGNLNNGDINVYTLGLNNSLYKDYKFGDRLSMTPSINLDLTYYYQDEYEETGKEFLVNADKTDEIYVSLGAGIDFKYDILKTDNSKLSLINNFEYYYDILNNDGNEIDLKNSFGKFSEEKREMDKESLSYSIGLNYEYNDLYNIQVKYSKEIINDVDNEKIGIDFSYRF
ncbi:MAG: autotransporter outer membrane beta-barrel domain-containing protein [Fusobacterium sp.]|nr:autotransporter outer membrane beta-barrel domain-containing protein [Fusobacterium sp.]